VSVADLPAAGRWPRFTAAAAEVGFAAVHALPMRLRTEVIGALNFFDTSPGALDVGRLRIGQALADVATIGRHRHAQGFRLIRDGFVDLDSWAPDHMPELQLAGRLPLRARPLGRRLRQPVARVQTSRMALVDEPA